MTALWQRRPAGRASMHWSSTSATYSRPPRRASSTLSTTLLQKAQILSGATPSLGGKDRPQHCLMVSIPSSTFILSMPHQQVCLDGDNHALSADFLSGTQLPPLEIMQSMRISCLGLSCIPWTLSCTKCCNSKICSQQYPWPGQLQPSTPCICASYE